MCCQNHAIGERQGSDWNATPFWHIGRLSLIPQPPALLLDQRQVPAQCQGIYWRCDHALSQSVYGEVVTSWWKPYCQLSAGLQVWLELCFVFSGIWSTVECQTLRGATKQCRGIGIWSKANQNANSWLFCEPVLWCFLSFSCFICNIGINSEDKMRSCLTKQLSIFISALSLR